MKAKPARSKTARKARARVPGTKTLSAPQKGRTGQRRAKGAGPDDWWAALRPMLVDFYTGTLRIKNKRTPVVEFFADAWEACPKGRSRAEAEGLADRMRPRYAANLHLGGQLCGIAVILSPCPQWSLAFVAFTPRCDGEGFEIKTNMVPVGDRLRSSLNRYSCGDWRFENLYNFVCWRDADVLGGVLLDAIDAEDDADLDLLMKVVHAYRATRAQIGDVRTREPSIDKPDTNRVRERFLELLVKRQRAPSSHDLRCESGMIEGREADWTRIRKTLEIDWLPVVNDPRLRDVEVLEARIAFVQREGRDPSIKELRAACKAREVWAGDRHWPRVLKSAAPLFVRAGLTARPPQHKAR